MIHPIQRDSYRGSRSVRKKEERRVDEEEEEQGGRDIPLPTFIICSTLAYNCTFAANLHHIPDPGEAVKRSANSL
jgi:hypothetical protein